VDTAQLIDRMIRAARLDVSLYDEVEADAASLPQAVVVVLLSSLAAGFTMVDRIGVRGLIANGLLALAFWYGSAFVIYFVGTRMLPEPQTKADPGQLLRVLGFAYAPGVLRVFGIVPAFAVLAVVVSSIWMVATMIVAVRQALDYSGTMRAMGVCAIFFLIYTLVFAVLVAPFMGSAVPEGGMPIG